MKPPYEISPKAMQLLVVIAEKIGVLGAHHLIQQSPKLRKDNRIRTIQASLQIEGNTLSVDQVSAVMEKKRVLGPKKDVEEVLNALKVYQQLNLFNPLKQSDFLKAHSLLLSGLIEKSGQYRKKGVAIVKGDKLEYLASGYTMVPVLMRDLFQYLKTTEEVALVKSCVFHYELEFIHPFIDGNGRMGRLWQSLILMSEYPVFEFIPVETLIAMHQNEYYRVLSACDKEGKSTKFIDFMLSMIDKTIDQLLEDYQPKKLQEGDRIRIFLEQCSTPFSRKDYLACFPTLSTATASRDLRNAVDVGILLRTGDKMKTVYTKGKNVASQLMCEHECGLATNAVGECF
jgi:Fic family protein